MPGPLVLNILGHCETMRNGILIHTCADSLLCKGSKFCVCLFTLQGLPLLYVASEGIAAETKVKKGERKTLTIKVEKDAESMLFDWGFPTRLFC